MNNPIYSNQDPRYLAMKESLAMSQHECQQLRNELIELNKEKERRIYYQDIVYNVCNLIDRYIGYHVCCGTVDNPTEEVQDTLREILR